MVVPTRCLRSPVTILSLPASTSLLCHPWLIGRCVPLGTDSRCFGFSSVAYICTSFFPLEATLLQGVSMKLSKVLGFEHDFEFCSCMPPGKYKNTWYAVGCITNHNALNLWSWPYGFPPKIFFWKQGSHLKNASDTFSLKFLPKRAPDPAPQSKLIMSFLSFSKFTILEWFIYFSASSVRLWAPEARHVSLSRYLRTWCRHWTWENHPAESMKGGWGWVGGREHWHQWAKRGNNMKWVSWGWRRRCMESGEESWRCAVGRRLRIGIPSPAQMLCLKAGRSLGSVLHCLSNLIAINEMRFLVHLTQAGTM